MRKRGNSFIAGFLCGAILLGATSAYAASVLAIPSAQRVLVDGKSS